MRMVFGATALVTMVVIGQSSSPAQAAGVQQQSTRSQPEAPMDPDTNVPPCCQPKRDEATQTGSTARGATPSKLTPLPPCCQTSKQRRSRQARRANSRR
jgi:hypothetical protein